MNNHLLAVAALSILSLAACGKPDGDEPAAASKTAASETTGSIDLAITAETIGTNSRGDSNSHQCQLAFVATNNSGVDIKSMHIEFDALPAVGGAPIGGKLALTMPMLIKAGASQEAWGNVTVDNFSCDALQLSFPPQRSFQCRTSTKAPCAPYHFSASGIAIAG